MTEETTPTTPKVAPEPDAAARPPGSPSGEPATPDTADNADTETEEEEQFPKLSFEDMNLDATVMQAIDDMGYEQPMDVQSATYGAIREGNDVMVQARTGTGKTAAFMIPIVQGIDAASKGAQALILCPTRELAMQVAREAEKLAVHKGVKVIAVYGGAPMQKQIDAFQAGAQIIAGTPGRVFDHIRRRNLLTKDICHLVLDECDEMLSMGFQEEIENIINTLPPKEDRQTMLFSATIPQAIQRIARRHMTKPMEISLSDGGISVDEIDHHYYIISGMVKTKALLKVLMRERPEQAIIFCNTREDTNVVAKYLKRQGYNAEAISSDLSQRDRERVMKKMREGKVRFMCATDVAARGIDINDLSHVFNYGFPESPEVYVHRTGRTGRAGKRGIAISLVGPREIGSFYFLKLTYKIKPEERELPDEEEFKAMVETDRFEKVTAWVSKDAPEEWKSLARRVWDSENGENVLGALLEHMFQERTEARKKAERAERAERSESEDGAERPRERERSRSGRGRDRDSDRDERRPRRARRRREEGRDGDGEKTGQAVAAADASETPAVAASDETNATESSASAKSETSSEASSSAKSETSSEASTSAKSETSSEAKSETSSEAKDGDSTNEDGTKRRRRRRRRRPRKAEGEATQSASSESDGREFWETWADEKNGQSAEGGTPSGADSSDGSEASEASKASEASEASEASAQAKPAKDSGPNTVRLYVNIGKREDATADDLREFLAGILGDDAEQLGAIALRNTHAYVRVPEEFADAVIDGSAGKTYGENEREVVIERAKR